MKKSVKNVVKKLIGIGMLSAAIVSAVPLMAHGISGSPIGWTGDVATPGSAIYTSPTSKVTASSVMVLYTYGGSEFIGASVLASQNVGGSYSDVTLYTSAHPNYYIYKDTSSYIEVLNLAYETYGKCYVKTKYITTSAGYHAGNWMSDVY